MTWKRNTSGFIATPPKWKSDPKTKAVRIPVSLVDEVLEIAHQIDDERTRVQGENREIASVKSEDSSIADVIAILEASLKMQANRGGAIKKEIKKALELLK